MSAILSNTVQSTTENTGSTPQLWTRGASPQSTGRVLASHSQGHGFHPRTGSIPDKKAKGLLRHFQFNTLVAAVHECEASTLPMDYRDVPQSRVVESTRRSQPCSAQYHFILPFSFRLQPMIYILEIDSIFHYIWGFVLRELPKYIKQSYNSKNWMNSVHK